MRLIRKINKLIESGELDLSIHTVGLLKEEDILTLIDRCVSKNIPDLTRALKSENYLFKKAVEQIFKKSHPSSWHKITEFLQGTTYLKDPDILKKIIPGITGSPYILAEQLVRTISTDEVELWEEIILMWPAKLVPALANELERKEYIKSKRIMSALIHQCDGYEIPSAIDGLKKNDYFKEEDIILAVLINKMDPYYMVWLVDKLDKEILENQKIVREMILRCPPFKMVGLAIGLDGHSPFLEEEIVHLVIEQCDGEEVPNLARALRKNPNIERESTFSLLIERCNPRRIYRLAEMVANNPNMADQGMITKMMALCDERGKRNLIHSLLRSDCFRMNHINDPERFLEAQELLQKSVEHILAEEESGYGNLSNLNKIYFLKLLDELENVYDGAANLLESEYFLGYQKTIAEYLSKTDTTEDRKIRLADYRDDGHFALEDGEEFKLFEMRWTCMGYQVPIIAFEMASGSENGPVEEAEA